MDPTLASREGALSEALERGDPTALRAVLVSLPPTDVPLLLTRLPDERRARLFSLLAPEEAASLARGLQDATVADAIHSLSPERAARIVGELSSGERVDVLAELPNAEAEAILDKLPSEDARDVRELRRYPPDTAGGVMGTEFVAYPGSTLVAAVLADLRSRAAEILRYEIQYAYVTDTKRVLIGVLRLRDLLLAPLDRAIDTLMLPEPKCVPAEAQLAKIKAHFDKTGLLGMPVVDDGGRLVGVVTRSEVDRAREEDAGATFLKASGVVGGEELRSHPLRPRIVHRLSWLSTNIFLNVAAASVIAAYQETLSAVIALAVFLPIISDMSGCSGNQAVAVTLRELTLGLLRPREILFVVLKELQVGIVNGAALGLLLGIVAFLWKGNPWLALVVGSALALNTLLSVVIGGTIPLLLKGLRHDPALASGPILTTITDTCGFFLTLGGARLVLARLMG